MRQLQMLVLITVTMMLAGCANHPHVYERAAGGAAVGALIGYGATGTQEGALRGASFGAAGGILTSGGVQRSSGRGGGYEYSSYEERSYYGVDPCEQYRHNQGAYGQCKRGQERRARERQRDLERQAQDRGYRGW